MVAIALAWLIVPLMRRRRSTALGREASNVAILRDQLRELDQDLATGAITPVQLEQVNRLAPNEPNVMVDYADALGASAKSLHGKPTELVIQALKIDPTNWKGLALAGTAAFDRRDYRAAVDYWQQLKQVLPPEST